MNLTTYIKKRPPATRRLESAQTYDRVILEVITNMSAGGECMPEYIDTSWWELLKKLLGGK